MHMYMHIEQLFFDHLLPLAATLGLPTLTVDSEECHRDEGVGGVCRIGFSQATEVGGWRDRDMYWPMCCVLVGLALSYVKKGM